MHPAQTPSAVVTTWASEPRFGPSDLLIVLVAAAVLAAIVAAIVHARRREQRDAFATDEVEAANGGPYRTASPPDDAPDAATPSPPRDRVLGPLRRALARLREDLARLRLRPPRGGDATLASPPAPFDVALHTSVFQASAPVFPSASPVATYDASSSAHTFDCTPTLDCNSTFDASTCASTFDCSSSFDASSCSGGDL